MESIVSIIQEIKHLLSENRLHEAAVLVTHGLETFPDQMDMILCAGVVQEKAGNIDDAIVCYETAMKVEPWSVEPISKMANLLIKQHRWHESIPFLEKMLQKEPNNPTVLLSLGTACLRISQYERAVKLLEKARQLAPYDIAILTNLGVTYRFLRRYEDAVETLEAGLQQNSRDGFLISALASVYTDMGDYKNAYYYSQKILNSSHLDAGILAGAAYPLVKLGYYDKAEELYRNALKFDSFHAGSRFGLGCILFLKGKFHEGWPFYQARFDIMQSWLNGPWPAWQGEDLRGKRLFVRAEQGAGDTIQFCRYIKVLHQMGVEVMFSFQPPLGRLLSCLNGYARLFPKKEINIDEIEADYQTALLDLPFLLGIKEISHITADGPYLEVSNKVLGKWREILSVYPESLKVGLVWAGNPNHVDDHNRSIKLSKLAPLSTIPGVRLYSLQIGEASSQLEKCRDTLEIVDLTQEITDFADTAAFIECLDVVVSVDTATAHLAGAIGKPVIILLPFSPDWRWFLDRDDSPWYPTARLLRQPAPGEWEPVIERLVEILGEWEK